MGKTVRMLPAGEAVAFRGSAAGGRGLLDFVRYRR